MTDHVTLRLHTNGIYLTIYVTSEGNWLHQILFRGFVANGVNTVHMYKSLFSFHFTNLDDFVYVHYMKSTKNLFKLQVVMQQNRKNAKVDEYFCKALYAHCVSSCILPEMCSLFPRTSVTMVPSVRISE